MMNRAVPLENEKTHEKCGTGKFATGEIRQSTQKTCLHFYLSASVFQKEKRQRMAALPLVGCPSPT